jgi:hypothetical protein
MIKRFKQWRADRKLVRNSEIQIYASRKTTLPLEKCNALQLRAGASFNRRKARVHGRRLDRQNHVASVAWNLKAAEALEQLADKLKPGQTVEDLPPRKRKDEVKTMLRITQGKAK